MRPHFRGVQDVVTATDGAALLRVELSPGADEDVFPDGFNPWRDCVGARVKARPRDGEANKALLALIAEHFDLPSGEVSIEHGARSRRKTIALHGLSVGEVRAQLEGVLPA